MMALQFLMGSFGEFVMVLLRLSGIMFTAPIFSNDGIPRRIKGFLVLITALVTFAPLAQKGLVSSPETPMEIMVLGAGEVVIGGTIGFIVRLVFTIFRVSGQFYSIQMGFGIINVFDPLAQSSVPIISQLKSVIMSILFLIIGGHHYILQAVFKSYEWIPDIYAFQIKVISREFINQFTRIFYLGFLIGIPLIGIVFLMTTALGILSKLAPQMNVMVIGFAVKVLVGVTTFIFLAPAFMEVAQELFNETFKTLYQIFQLMAVSG